MTTPAASPASSPAPSPSTSAMPSPSATTSPLAAAERHHMVTRARAGIVVPNPKYAHTAMTTSPTAPPTFVRAAMRDPDWRQAMQEEYDALMANGTWTLVPQPAEHTLSPANGSSRTSCTRMDLSSGARQDGLCAGSLSGRALIFIKRSFPLLNLQPSHSSSPCCVAVMAGAPTGC